MLRKTNNYRSHFLEKYKNKPGNQNNADENTIKYRDSTEMINIKPHFTIILFGYFSGNGNEIVDADVDIIKNIRKKYESTITFDFIIIGRTKFSIPDNSNKQLIKVFDGIYSTYYHIDDEMVYNTMKKNKFSFICPSHRLFGFNIVSYLSSIKKCSEILEINNGMLKNDEFSMFSRYDTFFKTPDEICDYIKDVARYNFTEEGLLRDATIIEDRFFVMKNIDLMAMMMKVDDIIKYFSMRAINNPSRNFPEAIFFDYFIESKIIPPKYTNMNTIVPRVVVNWEKYSKETFKKQLDNYSHLTKKNNDPIVLNFTDYNLPCFNFGLKSGLCMDKFWNNTPVTHCIKFNIVDETKDLEFNNILFQSQMANVQVLNYTNINITLMKNVEAANKFIRVMKVKPQEYNKLLTIKIKSNDIKNNLPLFRIVETRENIIWQSSQNPMDLSHCITIDTSLFKDEQTFEIQIINNSDIINKELQMTIEVSTDEIINEYSERNAIIFVGFDRTWKYPKQYDMWSNIIKNLNADVYIPTYEKCFDNVENEFPENVKFVHRKNETESRSRMIQYIRTKKHPKVSMGGTNIFLQFSNLKDGFKAIETHEHSIGKKYKYVFKFRTDIQVLNPNYNLDSFIEPNIIYMESDYLFYGSRNVMSVVCKLFDAKFDYYDAIPWKDRRTCYETLLKSIENNPTYIYDFALWKPSMFKNKLPAISIPIIPGKFEEIQWEKNPRQQMIDTCKYLIDPRNKDKFKINELTMTSLTTFDREPYLFQCEYFIIDWAIHHKIVVVEPKYFSMNCVVKMIGKHVGF